MTDNGDPDGARLARRAGSSSLGVMVSRITGLVREQTLAFLFPTVLLDAFYAAYTFPNTLRELLGEGALSKAFIATFAAEDRNRGRDAAHRLLDRVFRTLVPVALLVTALGVVFAPELVDLVFSRGAFDEPLPASRRWGFETPRELAVWLTRLMFPFIGFASLAALFMGGLQARGSFFRPAIASAFFNITTVVFGVFGYLLAPQLGLHPMAGLAIGVPVGGVVQMLAQAFWFARTGYRPGATGGPRVVLRDPAWRRVCRLFGPAALAAGTLQLNVLISRHFASAGTSWLSWFAMAYRLVQFPAGLINVAISNAALPSLTRLAEPDDREMFVRVLGQSGRLMAVLSLAAGAGLIGIAEPVVSLIYRRGAFTPEDALQVTGMLSVFAVGLPAFGATKLFTDAFFALGSTRKPLVIAVLGTGLTWIATRAFVVAAGFANLGLPLATVSVAWLSAGLLGLLLARHLGRDGQGRARARTVFSEVAGSALRSAPAALATGAAAFQVSKLVRARLGGGAPEELVTSIAGIGAGVLVWVLTIRVLAPREWGEIRDALFSPRRRSRSKKTP